MHVTFSEAELEFQNEVRTFFRDEYPDDIRAMVDSGAEMPPEMQVRWQKVLHERGWAGVNWPVEYGGTGWTPVQKYIYAREEASANTPVVVPFGLNMVGPVIYTFGSEAQKQRFLPDILASNKWWCQGYSEPGAGSDLASLKTKADLVGDHWVVNGTKTWTTLGQFADWIFCLVRTNTDVARRQEGISFLLIDMKSPGVTVTPIIMLDGKHEVNEIHFDNVRVPVSNLVLGEGRGFEIAQGRLGPGRVHHCMRMIGAAQRAFDMMLDRANTRIAFGRPLIKQQSVREDIAKSACQIEQARLLTLKAASVMDSVGNKGAKELISMIKIVAPNMALDVIDRAIQIHGAVGLSQDTPLAQLFSYARTLRLADGPDQVHMMQLGRNLARQREARA